MPAVTPVNTLLEWTERQPDHPAVIEGNRVVTYGDFGKRVRRLAAELSARAEHPKVLIHLPQGADAYAAMFGTLMAGGFYTPMNLQAPQARRDSIRERFRPDVIVTDAAQRNSVSAVDPGTHVIVVEEVAAGELAVPRAPADLAYVIFTSGSTGVPKGVMIPPGALEHYLGWAVPALAMTPDDRCTQHPNIGFDLSVIDIYATLCSGATLVPLTGAKYRLFPAQAVRDHAITVWVSVPSVIDLIVKARQLTHDLLGSLTRLFFCGEPLLKEHLDHVFAALPKASVINAYGPTEATVSCTELRLTNTNYAAHCDKSVAIGSAIPGMHLALVGGPSTLEGEIAIFGPQLASGYWADPERTREAFRSPQPGGEIAYHTGDWAAFDGPDLYFRQRIDRQVKVQGFRLELGDVDAALRQLGVAAAHTVFVAGRLVSFIEGGADCRPDDLTLRLTSLLPHYAVPSEIRILAQLPRNSNDKVDAQALKEML